MGLLKLGLLLSVIYLTYSRHSIKATDCYSATHLKTYQRHQICTKPEATQQDRKIYSIYQERKTRELNGWSCRVRRSRVPAMCGAWSHLKISDVPEFVHEYQVPASWCRDMVTRRKFKLNTQSQSFPLVLNAPNYFSLDEAGSLVRKDNSINCQGQTIHFRKQLLTNTIILTEYEVVVQETKFVVQGETIENLQLHLRLPCLASQKACESGSATFIWRLPAERCPLQFVRNIKPILFQETFLVDEEAQVALNQTGLTKIMGCSENLIQTQYPTIFLAEAGSDHHQKLRAAELDIDIEIKNNGQFLLFLAWKHERGLRSAVQQASCEGKQQEREPGPVKIQDNQYMLIAGDVVHVFTCPIVKLTLLESKKCYADIPVQSQSGDKAIWVDPITRLVKKHSSPQACSPQFPIIVQEGDLWIEIPTLRTIHPPIKKTILDEGEPEGMVDLSRGGLYTASEINSWEALLSFPVFQQALLKSISLGSCINEGLCSHVEHQQEYDLSRLVKLEQEFITPWDFIKQLSTRYGGICAILVLIYTIGKLCINAVLIALTAIKEGYQATLALLTECIAGPVLTYQRVRRRHQKIKLRQIRKTTAEEIGSDINSDRPED